MLTNKNLLLDTDTYKFSHFLQYPPNVKFVSSYIEARSGYAGEIVFAGIVPLIKQIESYIVTQDDIDEANEVAIATCGVFNKAGWEKYLGKPLPLKIQAVREGTVLKAGNVLVQVRNTDPDSPWMTSYFETKILRAIWYMTTVATNSREIKKVIKDYLELTGDPAGLPFKLHDFGFRGVSSWESASLGGLAHLYNFMGTDTVAALLAAREYYGEPMAGFSIPASEHSTITAWGRENEKAAYENMVNRFAGEGKIYACVSDSYNIFKAVDEIWGGELVDLVKDMGGTLVVRPDSGDPRDVTLYILESLGDTFGYTTNDKGYKVLDPSVRVIWGDGINIVSVRRILFALRERGWSADNIAFGMGGALLQAPQRDDLSFAMKGSAVSEDGVNWTPIQKDPITSKGKKSKAGRLALVAVPPGDLYTIKEETLGPDTANYLHVYYDNGLVDSPDSLSAVRERCKV